MDENFKHVLISSQSFWSPNVDDKMTGEVATMLHHNEGEITEKQINAV